MILAAIAVIAVGQSFTCQVVSVHDGDGPFHCANGISVRLAGIQAPDFEDAEPCRLGRAGFVCSNAEAARARDAMQSIILGKDLTCTATGRSYKRTVAKCSFSGSDLSCYAIAHGIAARWPRYDRAGTLTHCEERSMPRSNLNGLIDHPPPRR